MNTQQRVQCKRCVMDRSASEIVFTDTGCNFCDQAETALREVSLNKTDFARLFRKMRGKQYDCLIGLSGGADSSYALHLAVGIGLKPLCFSVDNGWNDPLADENIMKLVETLKVPFYRYNIDLVKFKDLQAAFIAAGLKNIEIPTDHILMAVSYELAAKYGIRYIISGGNVATESIMPASWGYNARDLTHIKDVYKKPLAPLPVCGVWKWNWYRWFKGIKHVYLLDYFNYNREDSIRVLGEKYGYAHPGEKHCESVWTKWFQNFYLFEKWGIDKRKAHLSSMIMSGQITRKEALEALEKNPEYPLLGIEDRVLKYPKHEHEEYKKDRVYPFIASLLRLCRF